MSAQSVKSILPFLLLLSLSACHSESDQFSAEGRMQKSASFEELDDMGSAAVPAAYPSTSPAPKAVERKLIKTGSLSFETSDMGKTAAQLKAKIKELNGYLSNERNYDYGGQKYQEYTVRVPAESFGALLSSVSEMGGSLESKSVSVQDVTEEFLDLETRLKTKLALEARYQELLQKAKSVQDMLDIERELGNLRADIESMEGRKNYLSNQVRLATLTITFHEPASVVEKHFGKEFANGFQQGWENLIWFFVGLVNIWPFLLIIGGSIFLLRKWWKKRNNR